MSESPKMFFGDSKIKKLSSWAVQIITALLVVASIAVFGFFILVPLTVAYQADAGFGKAKKTIAPEQVRAWALESIKNYFGTNGYSHAIQLSQFPESIKSLYATSPEMAWVSPKTSESEGFVGIVWGGGFFHWGFYIGPTNYIKAVFPDHQIAEWTAGIYYMHEGERKIW